MKAAWSQTGWSEGAAEIRRERSRGVAVAGGAGGGDGKHEVAEEGEGDADRADHEVFPGGLERAVVPVIVDERGAGEGGRLDGDPEEDEVMADADEGHGGEEEEEAAGEDRLGCVGAVAGARREGGVAVGEVLERIEGDGEEEDRGDGEEEEAGGVELDPAAEERGGGRDPGAGDEREVAGGGGDEQRAARRVMADCEGGQAGEKGEKRQGLQHGRDYSFSADSRSVSM